MFIMGSLAITMLLLNNNVSKDDVLLNESNSFNKLDMLEDI